jgi:hypothetical protein
MSEADIWLERERERADVMALLEGTVPVERRGGDPRPISDRVDMSKMEIVEIGTSAPEERREKETKVSRLLLGKLSNGGVKIVRAKGPHEEHRGKETKVITLFDRVDLSERETVGPAMFGPSPEERHGRETRTIDLSKEVMIETATVPEEERRGRSRIRSSSVSNIVEGLEKVGSIIRSASRST